MFSKHFGCEIVITISVILMASGNFVSALESSCGDWLSYKDEKCFKVIDNFFGTYNEAESNCVKLENSPTLAIVHSKEEQDFLANYLFKTLKKVDNFWIGAKFSNNSFKWADNSELNYKNWLKAPKNLSNYCLQMQSEVEMAGKWMDEPCEKKNAAVCQKMQTWSLDRLQKSHLEARKEFRDALEEANRKMSQQKHEIDEQKRQLDEANKKILDLELNSIPIGFIYTQLSNEKPPSSIWPRMKWIDVSATYAGVFFRVEGGGSEPFGKNQEENDRRVVRVETRYLAEGEKLHSNVTIDAVSQKTKTNDWIFTGDHEYDKNVNLMVLRLVTSSGEIRPRNMAIRVWKRTG